MTVGPSLHPMECCEGEVMDMRLRGSNFMVPDCWNDFSIVIKVAQYKCICPLWGGEV